MDIKCKKTMCRNNKCEVCEARGILIGNSLECKTFEKGEMPEQKKVAETMFESAPEIAPFRHNKTINIDCKAKCLFNNNGKCNANGISVLEGSKTGICGTNIIE